MYERTVSPGNKVSTTPLEAWRRLVTLVYPDFTEDELVSLSIATLRSLMPTYGILSDMEMDQIQTVWEYKQPLEEASDAPNISDLPPPSHPSAAPTPLISPSMVADPAVHSFSPAASWAQDDLQEVCIMKERGTRLGFIFSPGSLRVASYEMGSPAEHYGARFVGHHLTHVDGEPVKKESDVHLKTDDGSYTILRFRKESSASRQPSMSFIEDMSEEYSLLAPQLPTPFRPDSPEHEQAPPTPSSRRTPRKRRPVGDGKVEHPKPFEVPLPERRCSLGRRKRLSTGGSARANPNEMTEQRTEAPHRGKVCVNKGLEGCGYGSGGWFAGTDPYEAPVERPGKKGFPIRKCAASGNPNVPLEDQKEEARGKKGVQGKGIQGKSSGSDPNAIENPADPPRGRRRPDLLREQPHGVGDPNEIDGPCDPYAREVRRDGYIEGTSWMATLTSKGPGLRTRDPNVSCNPNETNESPPASPRKAPVRPAYASDHGPPGLWPDGGPRDKRKGLRKINAPDQGVMPNWSLCDAAANESASKGMRFITRKAGDDAASRSWAQAARKDARTGARYVVP
eukprot:TRINITY_DN3838_c0_g1_i2.p1 TRINITY_DN3838_c0_g1~~TRINITY_DN3838_c0_g1_i2.p1  ORF type:complete len:566 (+),score=111.76 TRINITY_DN3838_c0_g1_i2:1073-2770(+)